MEGAASFVVLVVKVTKERFGHSPPLEYLLSKDALQQLHLIPKHFVELTWAFNNCLPTSPEHDTVTSFFKGLGAQVSLHRNDDGYTNVRCMLQQGHCFGV